MLSFIFFILCASSYAAGIVLPRQNGAPDPGDPTVSDPPLQSIPATAKPDNTFSNGQPEIIGGFPYNTGDIPPEYQPRDIDIPFGRQFHGSLMMFPYGQLNQPDRNTDEWTPNIYDFANQSACGIPDNSYVQMKVAIHPYFLKYAGLDRKPIPHLAFPPSALLLFALAFRILSFADSICLLLKATVCKMYASLSGQKANSPTT